MRLAGGASSRIEAPICVTVHVTRMGIAGRRSGSTPRVDGLFRLGSALFVETRGRSGIIKASTARHVETGAV